MPDFSGSFDFSGLNPAQTGAVRHPGGPALVLAGPGSGKTFLIVNRIRYLTECCQAAPESILVITFTRAAARSMQRRFMDAAGGRILPVTFGTFHAVFYDILRRYGSYHTDSLITEEEKRWYLKQIWSRMPEGGSGRKRGLQEEQFRRLVSLIGFCKNNPNSPMEEMPFDLSPEQFQALFAEYQSALCRDGKLDFDDMAWLCLKLLRQNPQVLDKLHRQYKYILIDEYQDTNEVQDEVVRLLVSPGNEIFAVGDDDQAIYGFRGSAPGIMQKFEERYPGTKKYCLEINYRSSRSIVEASVKMIAQNKKRFAKKLCAQGEKGAPVRCFAFSDKGEEYKYLTERLRELSAEMSYGEMAVIARTNRDLEQIAGALKGAGIPWSAAERGRSRFRHFIVRDVTDCLEYARGDSEVVPPVWRRLDGDERKRKLLGRQTPYAALQLLRRGIGYDDYLHRKAAAECETAQIPEEWREILQILSEKSRNFSGLAEWKRDIEEHIDAWERRGRKRGDMGTGAEAGVQLLTMHGAKGLEFSYVCLPDVNEGILPGRQNTGEESIEEERRVFYVGMTRAKKILDILYLTGTKEYPRLPSRFLNPLLAAKDIYSSSGSSSSTSSSNS